MTICC